MYCLLLAILAAILGGFVILSWPLKPDVPGSVIETIKREEGYSATVYLDTLGVETIGYGFRLSEGFTKQESDLVLRERLEVRYEEVKHNLPWITSRSIETQGALLDMSWQLGVSGLLGFHEMLAALKARDCPEAKRQALNSFWDSETKGRSERVTERLCN